MEQYSRGENKDQVEDMVWRVDGFVLKGGPATTQNGQLPERLTVCRTGFVFDDATHGVADRSFIVVSGGNALPHRDRERPVSIEPIPVGPVLLQINNDVRPETVVFSSPWGSVTVDTTEPDKGGAVYDVEIQKKHLVAFDQGDKAAELFSTALGEPVRLTRVDPIRPSALPAEYRREDESPNVATGVDRLPTYANKFGRFIQAAKS